MINNCKQLYLSFLIILHIEVGYTYTAQLEFPNVKGSSILSRDKSDREPLMNEALFALLKNLQYFPFS